MLKILNLMYEFDKWYNGCWLTGKKPGVHFDNEAFLVIAENTLWLLWINRNKCYFCDRKANVESISRSVVAPTYDYLRVLNDPEELLG